MSHNKAIQCGIFQASERHEQHQEHLNTMALSKDLIFVEKLNEM